MCRVVIARAGAGEAASGRRVVVARLVISGARIVVTGAVVRLRVAACVVPGVGIPRVPVFDVVVGSAGVAAFRMATGTGIPGLVTGIAELMSWVAGLVTGIAGLAAVIAEVAVVRVAGLMPGIVAVSALRMAGTARVAGLVVSIAER